MGQAGVDLIGLTCGTPGNEFSHECGYAWPSIVFLEEKDGAEISTMGASERFMDIFDKGMLGGFRDVYTAFIVKGTWAVHEVI